ncbi:MAG: cytochrome c biogenesis protein CcsA [Verrucomicrobiota bacterium]
MLFYGISMVYSVFLWRKGFRQDNRVNYFMLLAAAIFHTTAMFQRGFSLDRCPVNNLFEATMFVTWTMVVAYLVFGIWSRLRFLGAFASPILFAIGVFALMPSLDVRGAKPEFSGGLVSLHATLILLSYGAFGLSSIAGIMYVTQEHDLKFHKLRAVFSRLPPIERLEKVMNWLLVAGFILLTLGLTLSPFLLKQKFHVYFNSDPKLIWSIVVWVIYLVLLLMHGRFGQGGRRFAWGAIGSFAFVLLTFWGVNLLSPAHQ